MMSGRICKTLAGDLNTVEEGCEAAFFLLFFTYSYLIGVLLFLGYQYKVTIIFFCVNVSSFCCTGSSDFHFKEADLLR